MSASSPQVPATATTPQSILLAAIGRVDAQILPSERDTLVRPRLTQGLGVLLPDTSTIEPVSFCEDIFVLSPQEVCVVSGEGEDVRLTDAVAKRIGDILPSAEEGELPELAVGKAVRFWREPDVVILQFRAGGVFRPDRANLPELIAGRLVDHCFSIGAELRDGTPPNALAWENIRDQIHSTNSLIGLALLGTEYFLPVLKEITAEEIARFLARATTLSALIMRTQKISP